MLCRNYHQPAKGTGLLRPGAARRVRAAPRRHRAPREEFPPADAPAQLQPDERDGLAVAGPHPQRTRPAGPARRTGRSVCVHPDPRGIRNFIIFKIFSLKYFIQHCIICRLSDSIKLEKAFFEPRTIATLALAQFDARSSRM